jgi:hypothetical protein
MVVYVLWFSVFISVLKLSTHFTFIVLNRFAEVFYRYLLLLEVKEPIVTAYIPPDNDIGLYYENLYALYELCQLYPDVQESS